MPKQYVSVSLFALSTWVVLTNAGVAFAAAPSKTYAIVIAANRSLDDDVAPLRFADDDAAKYFEMLTSSGVSTTLLTVLDGDAQRRFPSAAAAAVPPSKRALHDALNTVFREIERDNKAKTVTHFMFIYSGHGDVGPNREGYINLLDAKFYRSELFGEVIAKSPATFNHVILDACHAYYMVNKRGGADKAGDYSAQVRSFLSVEELSKYPNTGVLLAASSESETHEWGKWESGIFSHELRSALLGAADVNQDGMITYDEAAACVEAANSAIDVPRARLKVFYHPPASDVDVALITTASFQGTRSLVVPSAMAGKYYVEDNRGIRVADFNFSEEQPVRIALPGTAPFFLRSEDKEADIDGKQAEVLASNLVFRDLTAASRGSVEQSFRRDLYKTPFGGGFYRGMIAVRQAESPVVMPSPVQRDLSSNSSAGWVAGWSMLGAGIAVGAAGGITYYTANRAYADYNAAENEIDATQYQSSAEDRLLTSRILIGAGAAVAAAGVVFLVREAVLKKKKTGRVQAAAAGSADGAYVGVSGRF